MYFLEAKTRKNHKFSPENCHIFFSAKKLSYIVYTCVKVIICLYFEGGLEGEDHSDMEQSERYVQCLRNKTTVKLLIIQTPENFELIYLKLKQRGQTLGYSSKRCK